MVLHFKFRVWITLITVWCLSCCRSGLALSKGLVSFSHSPYSCEVHEELGVDRTRTADPNWPNGCPTPCHAMLNNYMGLLVGVCLGGTTAQGWAGHVSGWWTTALCNTWLVCIIIVIISSFFSIPKRFYLFFPDSPPHPTGRVRRGELMAAWCWAACSLNHNIHIY